VLACRAELAECPVWSAEEQAPYWVDIWAPALYRLASCGADMKTIFVTTLRHGVPADVLAAKPLSGGIDSTQLGSTTC
jgi:sugar lactone lactonase YvrE